jgi:hypothetical protein
MSRGIFEVTAVGNVVSLVARTTDGTPAMQLQVVSSHFGPWAVRAFSAMLNDLDPVEGQPDALAPLAGP